MTVREMSSARSIESLIILLQNLQYFYGDASVNIGKNGVEVRVIEETLTDGSKEIYYSLK